MNKLWVGALVLLLTVPAAVAPAAAITLEQARAECRALAQGAGGTRAREKAVGNPIAECVKRKMATNKKK